MGNTGKCVFGGAVMKSSPLNIIWLTRGFAARVSHVSLARGEGAVHRQTNEGGTA